MSKYRTVILQSGPAIRYQIKRVFGVSFLVINTNFKPLDHPGLTESELLTIDNIQRIDSTGVYPDGTGYIIYYIGTSYVNDEFLYNLVELKFKTYFNENNKN